MEADSATIINNKIMGMVFNLVVNFKDQTFNKIFNDKIFKGQLIVKHFSVHLFHVALVAMHQCVKTLLITVLFLMHLVGICRLLILTKRMFIVITIIHLVNVLSDVHHPVGIGWIILRRTEITCLTQKTDYAWGLSLCQMHICEVSRL